MAFTLMLKNWALWQGWLAHSAIRWHVRVQCEMATPTALEHQILNA